ncbi:hypothetical protein TrLO_g9694 [Triparma laevis f. longispina]|uniref:Uncharacterized protein n=1 Tax=Triparma laevis f. longispina TaxID=1714387 RepID=A0A9W7FGQ3_9STRA|nr:hypothetical protein TrLO_g9694 [Triparma laevis f. longispina]
MMMMLGCRRGGNEEKGANDAAIPSDEVKLEALVAIKQEQNGNLQENRFEENQAEELAMSSVFGLSRSTNQF